jgi:uncharacterized protein YsxB (DUF464 family)
MKQRHTEWLKQERILEEKLKNSKLFLNMCIHDMRNPATTIQLGLQHTIDSFNKINDLYQKHIEYSKKVLIL